MAHKAQYNVFLSHNSAGKPAVEILAKKLVEVGLKPWLDKWNLIPGEPWQEELENALDVCQTVAVFLGPTGISPWENEEMRSALEERVRDKKLLTFTRCKRSTGAMPTYTQFTTANGQAIWVEVDEGHAEFKFSQNVVKSVRITDRRGEMELTDELKTLFIETAKRLSGSDRRVFMARAVKVIGTGGQRRAEAELGWDRGTIRKGQRELESGFRCYDNFSARGRKRAEERLPELLNDLKAIVDEQSQTDSTFKTTRLYTRLSAAEVRQQLLEQQGYDEAQLPTAETIRHKLNQLGYYPGRVQKSQPLKKIPETDAIFAQVHQVNRTADEDETMLRISMDAKATVLIGLLSRGGQTRVIVKALDHDFEPKQKVTPFGIFLPQHNELYLYFTQSRLTSDFIVDCLCDFWSNVQERFPQVKTLVLNQDNGPENHSRRTQFIKRLLDFVDQFQPTVKLAYYPPYHSKYNPIERVWAILEKHWNGSLLDTLAIVLKFARSMTWKGHHPLVKFVKKTYYAGVRLTQKAMAALEKRLERLTSLEKWFVTISPVSP